ncbi:MAG TPA: tripartite tricarboxylate transporter substrate-binding protein [Candidatus Binatia bacterium]|nr:tripartite tricarboxylate transporter substrate-binding protein [Candidatus Binatia bacterium]
MKNKNFLLLASTAVFAIMFSLVPARATADDFYKGKTIRFIVGYAPGGGYDTYTRAVARHIGKFIPGNPSAVVENMEGAGSLLAANYMFNKADPDGLTVGNFNSGMVTQQALGSPGVRFDARKFGWIGAPVKGFPACMVMGFTGLRTLDDVLRESAKLKFAGTRAGASGVDLPNMMNALMGTKIKVIAGYKGTSATRLAMQKREAEGICSGWESMRVTARSMLDATGDDKLIPFIIHGKIEDPEVKDLPQFTEVLKGEENIKAFKTWANQYDFQRPLVVPPRTPPERLQTLRTAMQKTLTDAQFLEEAEKSKMLIDNVTGKEVEANVEEILSISPEIKKKLQFLVPGRKKTS